jgi:DNA-binding transcriptional ArsR family regulator
MGQPSGDDGKRKCGANSDPEDIEYVDGDMAKAMAHPLRIQIIAALNKRVMSPSGFSRKYDEKVQNVSYHFRILKEYDLIEEAGTRPVRGSTEHFYRATKRVLFDGKAWEDLPLSVKKGVSGGILSDFLEAVAIAMLGETFDSSDDRMAVWLQKRLDEQGWEEAVAAERELVHKMEDIYKGSRVRLAEAGQPEAGLLGTFGVFLFESPPEPDRPKDEAGD